MKSYNEIDDLIIKESASLDDLLDSDEIKMVQKIMESKPIAIAKRKQNKINKIARNRMQADKRLFWVGKNEFDVARKIVGYKPLEITTKVCLSCRSHFESEGSHNRMCLNCRKSNGYQE